MRTFQDQIADWDYRVKGIAADEFFKVVIRRSPNERPLWAWALEWNCNHRVVGVLGDEEVVRSFASTMPRLLNTVIQTGPKSYLTARTEVALPEHEDRLFPIDEEPK